MKAAYTHYTVLHYTMATKMERSLHLTSADLLIITSEQHFFLWPPEPNVVVCLFLVYFELWQSVTKRKKKYITPKYSGVV